MGTPGESALDGFSGYVTTGSLNGLIGKATNGAVIFLESRFFGLSNPLPTLTEEALALHTLEQALAGPFTNIRLDSFKSIDDLTHRLCILCQDRGPPNAWG